MHEDLCSANCNQFFDFLQELVVAQGVGVILITSAFEGTENALGSADVCVVDVPIDDVRSDRIAVDLPASEVRPSAQILRIRLVVELECLLGCQASLSGHNPVEEAVVEGIELRMAFRGHGGDSLPDARSYAINGSEAQERTNRVSRGGIYGPIPLFMDRPDATTGATQVAAASATIVLVVCDDAPVIGGAVASLLALEGGPYVIQIIDDGSTDGSWDRIHETIASAPSHSHDVRTTRFAESAGSSRLVQALEDVTTDCAVIARAEDRSRPERVMRLLHALQTTSASVVVSNRTRLGGSVLEHAGRVQRKGSGEIHAREIAFHLAWAPTNLGTMVIDVQVFRGFSKLDGPRLGDDLGSVLAFRGSLLGGCYYLDETLVDFKESRQTTAVDMRSRETCREGMFSSLIASRIGMLQDLRERQRDYDGSDANLVHLEASLKGALLELVERWTQARDELWSRDMRPLWVPASQLQSANQLSDRRRGRSVIARLCGLLPKRRSAA